MTKLTFILSSTLLLGACAETTPRAPSGADPLPSPLVCTCADHDTLSFAHDPQSSNIIMFADAGGPTELTICHVASSTDEEVSLALDCFTEVGSPKTITPYVFTDNNSAMTVAGHQYKCGPSKPGRKRR